MLSLNDRVTPGSAAASAMIENRFSVSALGLQELRSRAVRRSWRWSGALGDTLKRALDIVVSASLLTVAAPMFGIVALAIKLDSPGAVLFPQTRVGRHGHHFSMWKFRSMHVDAERHKAGLLAQNRFDGNVLFKMRYDPRITTVGRFLRRASIDELPQLWNVLKGDMSLVGPRPPLPAEVARYSHHDMHRLDAAPGITCLWQISGRSELPFPEQIRLDLEYIHTRSLAKDLSILARTIPAVVSAKGAY
ncbi:lipopolysaccharide/colanic/teichoic acid biosynthesis glycosyltransferase [Azospirillum baldaniorum]|uniref:sugar transferase n=1 Tax=Azospirillum baldaniorum TaxID=1064539 RepID=UPI0011A01A67|nr:sugar transferase [Azospirillum baldaniorum]TWA52910.1 lipopolysaccharide/colanic/teichoic acid biosynthesis glycosyltransferase [Azospirillum baldaniorum]